MNELRLPGGVAGQPRLQPAAPPPDVTNRGGALSQPDVARRQTGSGHNNPPDIMPPGGLQAGAGSGQLDLVNAPLAAGNASAASWFDNLEGSGDGDGWGDDDGWGVEENVVGDEAAPHPNQDPVGDVQFNQEPLNPGLDGGEVPEDQIDPVVNQNLESLLQESRAEAGRLQAIIR